MQLYLFAALGIILIIAGGLTFIISQFWARKDTLDPRLRAFVQDEAAEPELRRQVNISDRTRELSGSLNSRVILPIFRKIGDLIGRSTPTRAIEELRKQLYIAGTPAGLGPGEFYGFRLAFTVLGIALGYIYLRRGFTTVNLLLAILMMVMCVLLPVLWLHSRIQRKKDEIRRGLPDALDMLSVCADAGLGFDQSLQRVSEHWRTRIAHEFGRVVAEMEMGLSRRDSMHHLAERLDVTELSSFVAVIIQSDQLGMSISDTLHAQAEQMRIERRYRAQEQARTIPIKMLIPLAFLIFPAIIAIVIGPALPALVELFSSF